MTCGIRSGGESATKLLMCVLSVLLVPWPVNHRLKVYTSGGVLSRIFTLFKPEWIVSGFEDDTVMCDPVEKCSRHLGVAEYGDPFGKRQVVVTRSDVFS